MKIMDHIKQLFRQTPKSTVKNVQHNSFNLNSWFGNRFFGQKEHILETNETIFSIITRLSNTLASLPLKEMQKYSEVNDNLSQLVSINPNENMSAFEFINKLETDRNKYGNGYALIERDTQMQPINLIPLPNSCVEPMINQDDHSLWYHLMLKDQNIYVSSFNIIHVKHITGAERWVGISPLDVLRNTLKFNDAVQEFSVHEMDKLDSFNIVYGANVDEKKRDRVIKSVKDFVNENGGVLFSEPGVEVSKIDRDFQTGDIEDSDNITNRRIANAFNIPMQFINANSGGTFSSNEQLMTQFVQMTLTPIVRQYEQEFNRKLLTDIDRQAGKYFKFNMNSLLRGDVQARTQFYQNMRRSGVFTTNDILKLEDMPISDDKNADRLFVSGDLYPMDMDPSQRKGVVTNGKSKEVLDDEEDQSKGSTD